MGPADRVDVPGIGEVDPCADDVVETGTGLGERAADDLEAESSLSVGVGREDRRRPA